MSSEPTNPPADEKAQPRQVVTSWLIAAMVIAAFVAFYPQAAKTTLVFIGVLSVLVFVHEWGHYQFARWGGMKVNRFAIGFPPWIYTKRVKEVDYSIGALPIGGMVDIAGLGSEEEMVANAQGSTVENATRPARRDVPHGERQFQEASLGWRFWTLFAGPLMNFIFAMVVFVGIFSVVGKPTGDVTPEIDTILKGSPAEKAGITKGDRLLAVDNVRTDKVDDLSAAIASSNGKPVTLSLLREGKEVKLPLQPRFEEMESEPGVITKKPMIGIGFKVVNTGYKKVGFVEATQLGVEQSLKITKSILGVLHRAVTFNLTTSDKTNVGGPVKIAQVLGSSASEGILDVLVLAAALSVNLGLMNLLPFPALDGGRILFLGYEFVMRRPFDPRKEGMVHMVGMMLLLAFMLFITVRDVLPMIRG